MNFNFCHNCSPATHHIKSELYLHSARIHTHTHVQLELFNRFRAKKRISLFLTANTILFQPSTREPCTTKKHSRFSTGSAKARAACGSCEYGSIKEKSFAVHPHFLHYQLFALFVRCVAGVSFAIPYSPCCCNVAA